MWPSCQWVLLTMFIKQHNILFSFQALTLVHRVEGSLLLEKQLSILSFLDFNILPKTVLKHYVEQA